MPPCFWAVRNAEIAQLRRSVETLQTSSWVTSKSLGTPRKSRMIGRRLSWTSSMAQRIISEDGRCLAMQANRTTWSQLCVWVRSLKMGLTTSLCKSVLHCKVSARSMAFSHKYSESAPRLCCHDLLGERSKLKSSPRSLHKPISTRTPSLTTSGCPWKSSMVRTRKSTMHGRSDNMSWPTTAKTPKAEQQSLATCFLGHLFKNPIVQSARVLSHLTSSSLAESTFKWRRWPSWPSTNSHAQVSANMGTRISRCQFVETNTTPNSAWPQPDSSKTCKTGKWEPATRAKHRITCTKHLWSRPGRCKTRDKASCVSRMRSLSRPVIEKSKTRANHDAHASKWRTSPWCNSWRTSKNQMVWWWDIHIYAY